MEAFQQKRAEFIAQEIRNFDAETLYVFLEWIRGNGHKLDRITGMAVWYERRWLPMKKQRKIEKDNRGIAIYARKSRITNKGDSKE